MTFSVDVAPFAAARGLSGVVPQQLAGGILSSIALQFQRELYTLVDSNLKSTKATYKEGLVFYMSPSGTEAGFELTGKLPNFIEQGKSGYDLKPGILAGRSRRVSASGTAYAYVPFRFGTGIGENEAFSSVLPKDIQRIARNLSSTLSGAGGVQYGGSLSEAKARKLGYSPMTRKAVSSPNLTAAQSAAYTHKTTIYSGIYRERKTYNKATQSKYVSFRAVSEKSPANAFIHPGFVASNFFQKALSAVEPAIEAIVEKQIKLVLGDGFIL